MIFTMFTILSYGCWTCLSQVMQYRFLGKMFEAGLQTVGVETITFF